MHGIEIVNNKNHTRTSSLLRDWILIIPPTKKKKKKKEEEEEEIVWNLIEVLANHISIYKITMYQVNTLYT